MDQFSIGAVGVAIIGAIVSLVSLILSKEAKVSEFRQHWIGGLRDDIANAVSSVSTLLIVLNGKGDARVLHEWWSKTQVHLSRIELRLNRDKPDHALLIALIRETELMIRRAEEGKYEQKEAENLQDRVTAASVIILKREWERVKRGEAAFRVAKIMASLFIAGFLFVTLFCSADQAKSRCMWLLLQLK